jgi:hypothetical protein
MVLVAVHSHNAMEIEDCHQAEFLAPAESMVEELEAGNKRRIPVRDLVAERNSDGVETVRGYPGEVVAGDVCLAIVAQPRSGLGARVEDESA